MKQIRVIIVSDVRLYREGLASTLRGHSTIEVLESLQATAQSLEAISRLDADVVLIDLTTQDSFTIVRAVTTNAPDARIVALAVSDVDSEVIACAEAGVSGFVTRESSLKELVETVEGVCRGELRCSPKTTASLFRRLAANAPHACGLESLASLTRRELRILELVECGLSNKQIASELHIEVATVKNHVHNILDKLQVHSRGQAAALKRRSRYSVGTVFPQARIGPS